MRDHRTPEQVIRAIMEGQANAATLEYGTDLARDTYADDTPGQEPGDHTGKFQPVLANKTATAVDGVPKKGGEMVKPNPERLAGLGQKESYKGNPYLQMAKSDIIQENAYDQFVEMSDVEFDDMIDVLTIEELNDLEEGIISGTGKLLGSAAKGVGKLAVGAVKGGAKLTTKGIKAAAHRMSTAGRADAAEKKLERLKQKKKDKERLAKAKQGLQDLKGKPISWGGRESVQDSHALGSRDYWTETDEQDLTEGKMSKAEVKKHAAAIFKMRQQKQADTAASKALSKPKSAAAKAARRDAADAGYGTPMSDPADRDVRHKGPEGQEKRGRGQKDLPHIVSQLRGVVDTKDGAPSKVKFKDGTTKDVKPKHAQAWLNKHDSAKPHQKLDMYKSHDSHKAFKSYAKEAVDAEDAPKLKKLVKGLKGSSAGHKAQAKDIEKMIKDEKEFKVKNCGCGEDPCKTYGSKEEQMKDMQEAPGQRAWDRSSKGRAYRRLSDEEKARLLKKNELMRRAKAMKGDDAAYSTSRMRKPTLGGARQTYRGKKKTRREHNEMMEGIILGIEKKFLQEEEKMAGVEYYPRMKAHGKMTDDQKKAVTAVYDKKKVDKKMADDPHVKKAQRYMKVEQAMKGFMESSTWLQRTADDWNDHADHPHPKVQKHIKKAEKAYNDKDYDGFHHHTNRAADHAYSLRQKKKPNVQPKGAMGGPKKINHNPNVKEQTQIDELLPGRPLQNKEGQPIRNVARTALKVGGAIAATKYGLGAMDAIKKNKLKVGPFRPGNEPPTTFMSKLKKDWKQGTMTDTMKKGRIIPKRDKIQSWFDQPKKESYAVNEISDKLKTSYIKRAGQDVSHLEKLKDRKDHVRNVSLDRDDSYGHRVVSKKDADKVITKRRKGMRMATGKLGEQQQQQQRQPGPVSKIVGGAAKIAGAGLMAGGAYAGAKFADGVGKQMRDNILTNKAYGKNLPTKFMDVAKNQISQGRGKNMLNRGFSKDSTWTKGHNKVKGAIAKWRQSKAQQSGQGGGTSMESYVDEMSMSVTLKPKKNNMYKVTKVGDKMKKHGGIKKGEKFHDSQIDGMHDSGIKVKYEGKMQRQQHLQTTMKPLVKALATPLAGPGAGAAAAVGALASKNAAKKIAKAPKIAKAGAGIGFGPNKIGEATYDQVLKHRYQSDHPADNPQRSAYLGRHKSSGMDAHKPIPGKDADSKKGKMAAIKKQLKRRPGDYGIDGKHDRLYPANQGDIQKKAKRQKSKRTAGDYEDQKKGENLAGRVKKESYAARIAEKMNYPKSAQADMNKMADKSDKDWWKAQDKAKQKEDSNKAKLNKINNMGTRHGT